MGYSLKEAITEVKWFAIIGYVLIIIYSIYACNNPSIPVEDKLNFIIK